MCYHIYHIGIDVVEQNAERALIPPERSYLSAKRIWGVFGRRGILCFTIDLISGEQVSFLGIYIINEDLQVSKQPRHGAVNCSVVVPNACFCTRLSSKGKVDTFEEDSVPKHQFQQVQNVHIDTINGCANQIWTN